MVGNIVQILLSELFLRRCLNVAEDSRMAGHMTPSCSVIGRFQIRELEVRNLGHDEC